MGRVWVDDEDPYRPAEAAITGWFRHLAQFVYPIGIMRCSASPGARIQITYEQFSDFSQSSKPKGGCVVVLGAGYHVTQLELLGQRLPGRMSLASDDKRDPTIGGHPHPSNGRHPATHHLSGQHPPASRGTIRQPQNTRPDPVYPAVSCRCRNNVWRTYWYVSSRQLPFASSPS